MKSSNIFQANETKLMIPGPCGDLETVITCPPEARHDYFAVICHPHPLHGGTMNNKVVTTLARSFNTENICALRFNFRGVKGSAGQHADGLGESEDLLAILNWLHELKPKIKILLAGFSFGSYIAYRAAHQWPIHLLITVAPPVHHYDFELFPKPTCPWLVLQGEEDELVPSDQVFAWLSSLSKPPKIISFPDTGHFFHGQLSLLKQELQSALKELID